MAGAFTVVARIRAAKGKRDALEALLKEQIAAVLGAEPGCVTYRLHQSTSDPDQFLFYETFAGDAAFEVHKASPHVAAYRQRREKEGLTDGPVQVEIFRSLTD